MHGAALGALCRLLYVRIRNLSAVDRTENF